MKYSELLAKYQQEVDEINPEDRPLVTLACEIWVEILTYLEANCSRQEDTHSLFKKVMIRSRGHLNPSTAMLAVETWVESEKCQVIS